jgi:serine/threonine protein phosphatase PrpC
MSTPESLVLAVADGAGGQSGAARAAELSVGTVRQTAEQLQDAESCKALLSRLDQALCDDREAGETTCAIAVVSGNRVFGASVGDSGVWVITPKGHIDLSVRQMRKPFLGSGSALPVSFTHEVQTGELLLLATDGLLKYTSASRIVEACSQSCEAAVQQLLNLVRYPSGAFPDDVSVILANL